MTFPNFFVVGAPKAGTTALSEYLRQHPNILFSWPKEPHFFAYDFKRYRRVDTLDDYLGLFRDRRDEHLAVGEASVWYLYSSLAARKIHEFNPEAKIIVMLRNPVDLVHSLHSQMVFTFYDDEPDFETSWRLQDRRQRGERVPERCPEPKLLQYREAGRLGDQLERLLAVFDRKQVKVILIEDFSADTQRVYEDVLEFLGVPSDGRRDFPKINVNTVHRRPWLGRLLYHPPYPIRVLEPKIKKALAALGLREFRGWHRLLSLTSSDEKREVLSGELRSELWQAFADDVDKLSAILGRDLSHWAVPAG